MKKLLMVCLLAFPVFIDAQSVSPARSQTDSLYHLPDEIPVPLGNHLDAFYYEFSGLAKWRDSIVLLIPQGIGSSDVGNQLFGIYASDISQTLASYKKLEKQNEISRVLTFRFTNKFSDLLPLNGGAEAATVVGDTIFFAVEADEVCYLVKGSIDASNPVAPTITLQKFIPIKKPGGAINNAGFESLAWLPESNSLLAFFEKNDKNGDPSVYRINTSLDIVEQLKFDNTLLFRLTDVNADGATPYSLLGINHHYNDYNSKKKDEFFYYIGNPTDTVALNAAKVQMRGQDPRNLSFTRVVSIIAKPGQPVQWKEKKLISFSNDNWEGILPFAGGALMIIDGKPLGYPCRLSWFSMN
ncbi:MAG: hypothetical protein QM731_06235 [Chitinophagaceae bacterium]